MAQYENELLEMQGSALDRSNKNLLAMQPFMLESLGLKRNPITGKVERLIETDTADPFLNRFKLDQKARLLGNYKSPQMEAGLLSWANKMPVNTNAQARSEYDTNAAILREGINRGGLESGANLLSQREGLLSNLKARDTSNYAGMGENDLKLISGIGAALSPYQTIRERLTAERMQNEQNKATKKAGQMQLVGSIVGAIIMAVLL